ncbi:MAG: hypothetical protein QOE82_212 [Thermoanaerobaculia bacterium]|jgi:hypothetical protein|nr:hypothetical protein [Thermoanaerobaculia bacterium]
MTDEQQDAERFKASLTARAKSLEMLYDYTKFHIGVYLTLTAAYITAASAKGGDGPLLRTNPWLMTVAVACFLLAGLAAGIIVSSITQYDKGGSSNDFLETAIGPWDIEGFSGRVWTYIEHTSFWVGLLFAIASVVYCRICSQACG